jgi:uncharacterized protein (TIGR02217 family)
MSDLDIRFPERISFHAVNGPQFETDVIVFADGQEQRNANWEFERFSAEVAHAARRESEWRPLLAFFRLAQGRANTFRYKDWMDYICEPGDGVFFAATTGSPLGNQMYKKYTFEGQTVYRRITKPVSGTITITGGGTLDYATGIVDGGTPTAWYGEFDVWCRFDTDVMRAETLNKKSNGELLVGWQSIPIIEVKDEVV